ncbi:MAG: hypothetical protein H9917_03065 [Candidatus Oceanisphaera merdipullorum]|nr:hypothetical protein [Candidatus Oceanisphaera merdipullorum]
MRKHLIKLQYQQLQGLIGQRDKLQIKTDELRRQQLALEQARAKLVAPPQHISAMNLLNQGHIRQQLDRVLVGHLQQVQIAEQDQARLTRLSQVQAGKVKGLELLELKREQEARHKQQRQEWEQQLEWCLNSSRKRKLEAIR